MTQPVTYTQGTRDFLLSRFNEILPDMNTDLAAKVSGGFLPFELVVGSIPNVAAPRIALSFVSDVPLQRGDRERLVTITFRIESLIPVAGTNTTGAFETARQVSHDWVQTLLDDDSKMLNPYINAGLIGNVYGMRGDRGAFIDIFPRLMADNKTYCRGWQVPYAVTYSLQTR